MTARERADVALVGLGKSSGHSLREHSRVADRKLIDRATAVVDGHGLLPRRPRTPPRP